MPPTDDAPPAIPEEIFEQCLAEGLDKTVARLIAVIFNGIEPNSASSTSTSTSTADGQRPSATAGPSKGASPGEAPDRDILVVSPARRDEDVYAILRFPRVPKLAAGRASVETSPSGADERRRREIEAAFHTAIANLRTICFLLEQSASAESRSDEPRYVLREIASR